MDAELIQALNDAIVEVGRDPAAPPPATVMPKGARVEIAATPDPMRPGGEQASASLNSRHVAPLDR